MSLPVLQVLIERLQEFDPTFEYREGTPYSRTFFQPLQFIVQPVRDELDITLVNQSLRRISRLDDPNGFSEDAVDDLVENQYVYRFVGGKSVGIARLFFIDPVDRDYLSGTITVFSKSGLTYVNSQPVSISSNEMALNVEGGLYYMDVPVIAESEGSEYNIEKNNLVSLSGDDSVIRVDNPVVFADGLPRETNLEYLTRAKDSIGVRDLNTGKGINGTLNDSFPGQLQEIVSTGLGDPEMMRDIVYNMHVGSKTDIWVRPASISQSTFSAVGLIFDVTRQLSYESRVEMNGVNWIALGYPHLDRSIKQPIVESTTAETAAEILTISIPDTGIDLTGAEWIRFQVDSRSSINVRVAGVSITATKRNEIVNNVNNAVGFTLCTVMGQKIRFRSPIIGFGSQLVFTVPTVPRTDATLTLFPGLAGYPPEGIIQGVAATVYVENIDYQLNDESGEICRLPSGSITNGQMVKILFDYNPLSIDIGNKVPLVKTDMGLITSRGIRPGRENYTITDMAFLNIVRIDEIDPETLEVVGTAPLNGVSGFGMGGFGLGPFGVGSSAEYRLRVLSPHERFSVFEHALLTFKPEFFGRSVRVTYNYSPKIVELHDFCYSDKERVTSEDILCKNVIPAFVSANFRITVDATDTTIPTDASLISELSTYINSVKGKHNGSITTVRLEKGNLVDILKKYADYVDVDTEMLAVVHNNDGSTRAYRSTDVIEIEQVTLAKDADNIVTPKITRFYAGDITITRL